jgi:hypothetical protein
MQCSSGDSNIRSCTDGHTTELNCNPTFFILLFATENILLLLLLLFWKNLYTILSMLILSHTSTTLNFHINMFVTVSLKKMITCIIYGYVHNTSPYKNHISSYEGHFLSKNHLRISPAQVNTPPRFKDARAQSSIGSVPSKFSTDCII